MTSKLFVGGHGTQWAMAGEGSKPRMPSIATFGPCRDPSQPCPQKLWRQNPLSATRAMASTKLHVFAQPLPNIIHASIPGWGFGLNLNVRLGVSFNFLTFV